MSTAHDRAQAVQMFKDNTALTDQNIGTEVDRYISAQSRLARVRLRHFYLIDYVVFDQVLKRPGEVLWIDAEHGGAHAHHG